MNTTQESWLGEFFSDCSRGEGIPGLVHYSHSQGVTVRFLQRISSPWIQPSILYGILETGEECTLVDPSYLPGIGPEEYHQNHDGATVVSGVIGYKYLVIGKHIDPDDNIGEVSFSFPDIGSFATGLDAWLQAQQAPLAYCDQTIIGKMSIWRQDSGSMMLSIKEAVHSSNSAALESLCRAHDTIKKEHDAYFMRRQKAEYRIILEFPSSIPLHDACLKIQKLVDLFSILLYSPIIALSMVATKGSLEGRRLRVYRSLALDERTLGIIQSRRNTRDVPITLNAIRFSDIVKKWSEECEKYSSLVSCIQSRTSMKALHEIYAEITLHCAFMDSIKHEAGLGKNQYEECIKKFAYSGLQEKILAVFDLDKIEETGVAICDVRTDIVHFRGARKWINKLPAVTLCQLSLYLELTVIGYLLEKLGVDRELIDKYQMLHATTSWSGI